MRGSPDALLVDSLTITLGRRALVDRVSLSLCPGEIVGLFGPSGAGKSLSLLAIAGLLPQRARCHGNIWLSGRRLSDLPPEARHRLGLSTLLQDLGLFGDRTVLENVMYPLLRRGLRREDARSRAVGTLERLHIADLALRVADRERGGLSGGQQQRVALARLLVTDPHVLLLDEPLKGLDATRRHELLAWIRLLALEGRAILFVSHQADELDLVADRVVRIEDGRIASVESRVQSSWPGFASMSSSYLVPCSKGDSQIGFEPRVISASVPPATDDQLRLIATLLEVRHGSSNSAHILVRYCCGTVAWLHIPWPTESALPPVGETIHLSFSTTMNQRSDVPGVMEIPS